MDELKDLQTWLEKQISDCEKSMGEATENGYDIDRQKYNSMRLAYARTKLRVILMSE